MAITVSQVTNTQTFGTWLTTTNRLANLMTSNTVTTDSTSGGSLTTGNGFVNGYFGANFLYVANTLVGGNVSANGTLRAWANLSVVNASANVFVVISTGSVGIANSTPDATLAVTGTMNVSSLATFGGAVRAANLTSTTNVATFGTATFLVSNGNVGLGTSSPGQRLEVSGSAGLTGNLGIGTTSPLFDVHVNDSDTPTILLQEGTEGNTFIGQVSNNFFIRRGTSGASDSLTIAANGHVGINASSPASRFTVDGIANVTTSIVVGANVTLNTSSLFIGNSTVNTTLSSNTLSINSNGAVKVPAGSTADRPTGTIGQFRFNTTINSFEGHNGTAWGSVGGGATGGGTDRIFHLNDVTINSNYTIPTGQNAGTFGPVTIASGVVVTVPSSSTWTIV